MMTTYTRPEQGKRFPCFRAWQNAQKNQLPGMVTPQSQVPPQTCDALLLAASPSDMMVTNRFLMILNLSDVEDQGLTPEDLEILQ